MRPTAKKAWAAKFKKYAVLARVNEMTKRCHGIRKARAEVAAYADFTRSQMIAMFGWTNPSTSEIVAHQRNPLLSGVELIEQVALGIEEPQLRLLDEKSSQIVPSLRVHETAVFRPTVKRV